MSEGEAQGIDRRDTTGRHEFHGGGPHAEFADAVRFIGTPAELARSYNELLGPEATEKFRRGRRIRRRIVLGLAIVALAAAVIYCAYLRERQHDVNITEEKTIVIYKTEEGENP